MGGKKKGKGKKGKKSKVPEEPDDSTERLVRFYKKKCIEYSVPQSKIMKGYFTEFEEDQADVTKVRHLIPDSFVGGDGMAGCQSVDGSPHEGGVSHVHSPGISTASA